MIRFDMIGFGLVSYHVSERMRMRIRIGTGWDGMGLGKGRDWGWDGTEHST